MSVEAESGGRRPRRKSEGKGMLVILVIGIITVLMVTTTVYVFNEYSKIDVPVLQLSLVVSDGRYDTEFERWDGSTSTYRPYIQNISRDASVKQASIKAPESKGDDPLTLPAVVVRAYRNSLAFSYWTSAKYTGPGIYNFTIRFKEPPQEGDIIKILIEVNDINGDDVFPYYTQDMANHAYYHAWE